MSSYKFNKQCLNSKFTFSDTMLGFVSTNGVFLLSMAVLCSARSALRGMFPDKYPPMLQNGVDPGKPLFLTPLVEKGQFDMGKGNLIFELSVVKETRQMNTFPMMGIKLEFLDWNKNPTPY